MRWFSSFLFSVFALTCLHAQDFGTEIDNNPPTKQERLNSLETITSPLASALEDVDALQAELKDAASDTEKEEIQARIDFEKQRIEQLRENFRDILGGSEAAEYGDIAHERKGLKEQVSELFQPFLSAVRETTAGPRELDSLRKSLETAQERKRKADIVLARIDELTNSTENSALIRELKSAQRIWASRQAQATSEIAVSQVQIDDRTRDRRSLWETISTGLSNFFKSRGINLILAILISVLGFILTRKLYFLIRRFSPIHKNEGNNFTTRISDVLALAIAVIVAISGIILVFYVRGDWLLLTLVVIFLIGIAWASKTAIPPYLDQIRMILNLGSVREGERIVFRGLPWKVSKLGFYSDFTNPLLDGGHFRIPIRDVMDMISRPIAEKEVWFPCEIKNWVILSDETYGKSISQTPEQVSILRLGGSIKTYPTADFLSLSPENLSKGFRVRVTFGIDYAHQADCTTTIPEIFNNALNSYLFTEHGKEKVRSVKTEFASASSSSLDYEILADFDGSMASRLNTIRRSIQRVCVDTCNENGWVIPFTQVTIHQSDS